MTDIQITSCSFTQTKQHTKVDIFYGLCNIHRYVFTKMQQGRFNQNFYSHIPWVFIFAHTPSLCIYSAKRCKYKKQNSFLTHNSEVSTSPWAEVSRFFLRRRTVRPSDRSQSTDRTQLRALCSCSTSMTTPSATWVHLWNYR